MGAEPLQKHEPVARKKRFICSCGDTDCMLVEIPRISDHSVYVDKMVNGHLVVAKREPCFCDLRVNHWGDTS